MTVLGLESRPFHFISHRLFSVYQAQKPAKEEMATLLPTTQPSHTPHHLENRAGSFCPCITRASEPGGSLNKPALSCMSSCFFRAHTSQSQPCLPAAGCPHHSPGETGFLLTVVRPRVQKVFPKSYLKTHTSCVGPRGGGSNEWPQACRPCAPCPGETGWRGAILDPLTHQRGGGGPCPVFYPENKVLLLSSPEAGLPL